MTIDRATGVSDRLAMKAPCRLATTANHALNGLAAIDGVTPAEGDRILVWQQTAATANGIYLASSGAWTRAKDFDGNTDFVTGTEVRVQQGTSYAGTKFVTACENRVPLIGTDDITFLAPATTSTIGAAGSTSTQSASEFKYYSVYGVFQSEVDVEQVVPCACLIRNVYVRLSTAQGSGSGWTITSRKNGATGNISISLGSTVQSGSDLVHQDVLAAGDRFDFRVDANASVTGAKVHIGYELVRLAD